MTDSINNYQPFKNTSEELEYYKLKYQSYFEQLVKCQNKIKSLENSGKKSTKKNCLSENIQNMNLNNNNNSSHSFLTPLEFKNLWEYVIKTELIEAFDFCINDYVLIANLCQDIMLLVYEECKRLIELKLLEVLKCLNFGKISKDKRNEIFLNFLPFFQENFNKIFMFSENFFKPLNEKLLAVVKEYEYSDGNIQGNFEEFKVENNDIVKDKCNKKNFEEINELEKIINENHFNTLIKNFHNICIYMLLHDPILTFDLVKYHQRKLKYCFYHKDEYINVDGFGNEKTPCILLLSPPLIKNKFYFNELKPPVYLIANPNDLILKECELNEKFLISNYKCEDCILENDNEINKRTVKIKENNKKNLNNFLKKSEQKGNYIIKTSEINKENYLDNCTDQKELHYKLQNENINFNNYQRRLNANNYLRSELRKEISRINCESLDQNENNTVKNGRNFKEPKISINISQNPSICHGISCLIQNYTTNINQDMSNNISKIKKYPIYIENGQEVRQEENESISFKGLQNNKIISEANFNNNKCVGSKSCEFYFSDKKNISKNQNVKNKMNNHQPNNEIKSIIKSRPNLRELIKLKERIANKALVVNNSENDLGLVVGEFPEKILKNNSINNGNYNGSLTSLLNSPKCKESNLNNLNFKMTMNNNYTNCIIRSIKSNKRYKYTIYNGNLSSQISSNKNNNINYNSSFNNQNNLNFSGLDNLINKSVNCKNNFKQIISKRQGISLNKIHKLNNKDIKQNKGKGPFKSDTNSAPKYYKVSKEVKFFKKNKNTLRTSFSNKSKNKNNNNTNVNNFPISVTNHIQSAGKTHYIANGEQQNSLSKIKFFKTLIKTCINRNLCNDKIKIEKLKLCSREMNSQCFSNNFNKIKMPLINERVNLQKKKKFFRNDKINLNSENLTSNDSINKHSFHHSNLINNNSEGILEDSNINTSNFFIAKNNNNKTHKIRKKYNAKENIILGNKNLLFNNSQKKILSKSKTIKHNLNKKINNQLKLDANDEHSLYSSSNLKIYPSPPKYTYILTQENSENQVNKGEHPFKKNKKRKTKTIEGMRISSSIMDFCNTKTNMNMVKNKYKKNNVDKKKMIKAFIKK